MYEKNSAIKAFKRVFLSLMDIIVYKHQKTRINTDLL